MMTDGQILKIGTLFSGIGAFEEALNQLGLPYSIEFACDNGEIELIPLPAKERTKYRDLEKRAKTLSEEEKLQYQELRDKISAINEEIRQRCYQMPTKQERIEYVDSIYKKYTVNKFNWV